MVACEYVNCPIENPESWFSQWEFYVLLGQRGVHFLFICRESTLLQLMHEWKEVKLTMASTFRDRQRWKNHFQIVEFKCSLFHPDEWEGLFLFLEDTLDLRKYLWPWDSAIFLMTFSLYRLSEKGPLWWYFQLLQLHKK